MLDESKMDIRTYRASSLQAALDLVRRELGPDAAVLQTRQIGTGLLGLLGHKQVEVQASKEVFVARRTSERFSTQNTSGRDSRESNPPGNNRGTAPSQSSPAYTGQRENYPQTPDLKRSDRLESPVTKETTERNKSDSNSKSSQYRSVPTGPAASEHDARLSLTALEILTELLDAGMEPELAKGLLQQITRQLSSSEQEDPWLIRGRLCQSVQRQISIAEPMEATPNQQQIIAAVGPTGVGKTTTIAKLAAGFHFDDGHQVGFISTDTFRLGAIEQLRQYAEMTSAPLEIVRSPDQMPRAIHRLQACHTIMIDTSGSAPADHSHIQTLREFMLAACPTSVYLVLSATNSIGHAQAARDAFSVMGLTHLVLTKLDEIVSLGGWYRTLKECNLPLSYVTTGQQVPQDIHAASRRRIAGMILGQMSAK